MADLISPGRQPTNFSLGAYCGVPSIYIGHPPSSISVLLRIQSSASTHRTSAYCSPQIPAAMRLLLSLGCSCLVPLCQLYVLLFPASCCSRFSPNQVAPLQARRCTKFAPDSAFHWCPSSATDAAPCHFPFGVLLLQHMVSP